MIIINLINIYFLNWIYVFHNGQNHAIHVRVRVRAARVPMCVIIRENYLKKKNVYKFMLFVFMHFSSFILWIIYK